MSAGEQAPDMGADDPRFRALADSIDALVFVTEPTGRMLWTNQRFIDETGYRAQDFWFENADNPFLHPDDAARVGEFIAAFVKSGDARSGPIENRFFDRWGRIHSYRSVLSRVTWQGRDGLLIVTRSTDAASAPSEAEASFRELVDSADDGILKLSRDGRFHFSNPRFHELMGLDAVELKRRTFFDLLHPEDAESARAAFAGLNPVHANHRFEARVTTPDGKDLCVDVNATLLRSTTDAGLVLAIVRDVTETRELERKMREAQKLESLGVFAGGIAHDFNNLMTAVLANATHAETLVGSHPEVMAPLHAIHLAGKQAAALSKSLLAYIGQAPTVAEATDLSSLVVDIVALGRSVVPKHVELRAEAPMGPVGVVCDRSQLSQLVMNLLNNAAEAIGDDKGVVTATTDVVELGSPRRDGVREADADRWVGAPPGRGRWARLRITDSGHGMSREVRARIFDPFFSTKASGRGLGLAAVLGIVRSHGGAIAIETERSKGSTFEVLLPLGAAAARAPRVDADREIVARPGSVTKPVLFVDDEWVLRETGRQILEDAGFEVMVAADGAQALALFDADPDRFAAVLVDLTMPGPSGDIVIARMRERRPDLPVVRMSGYRAPHGDMPESRGAVFIEKPYDAPELARAVLRAIALARG